MGDAIVCDTNIALKIGHYDDHVVNKREKMDDIKNWGCYLDLSLNNQGGYPIDYMEDDNVYGLNSTFIGSDSNKDDDKENINNNNGGKKKLHLTREQTKFLDEMFKHNHIISMTEKQVIAAKLNLKPRQVDVWFQNRRARTKLKQTEVDYEFMKKYYESLSKKNKRLKRELQELISMKCNHQTSPMLLQFSKVSKRTFSS